MDTEGIGRYSEVVMLQGEEGREISDRLYNVEGYIAHGATAESVFAVMEELMEYDNGDLPENDAEEVGVPWGEDDDVWVEGEYVLTAHPTGDYVALTRVLTRR